MKTTKAVESYGTSFKCNVWFWCKKDSNFITLVISCRAVRCNCYNDRNIHRNRTP